MFLDIDPIPVNRMQILLTGNEIQPDKWQSLLASVVMELQRE
jgi:hypothetical protein